MSTTGSGPRDGNGDGDEDEIDWLASQFDATQQVPKQAPPVVPPAVVPPAAAPPAATPPAAVPPTPRQSAPRQPDSAPGWPTFADASPPAEAPAPVWPEWNAPPPEASPPPAAPAGGFSWNLKPRGTQPETPTEPATPAPPAPPAQETTPPPLIEPADVPTQAMTFIPTAPVPIPPTAAPPVSNADIPTQAIQRPPTPATPWDPFATQDTPVASTDAADPDAAAGGPPTEAFTVQPWMPATPPAEPASVPPPAVHPAFPTSAASRRDDPFDDAPAEPRDPTSALDSLFGTAKFQTYEEAPILGGIVPPPTVAPDQPFGAPAPRAPLTSGQRTLAGVAGALFVVLVMVVVFLLGRGIGAASSATPDPAPTTKASGAPSTTTDGLAAPGVRSFNALNGGECIQPFSSSWAATFTVVDCSADHNGQLISKGELPESAATPYPTTAQLTSELTTMCSDPKVLNYAQAKKVTGLQLSFGYPPSSDDWTKGDRTYYCFASIAAGGSLPSGLAVSKK